ncbi:hypothetical protein AB0G74_16940 [Streptomyces sp. NPDC020875]|uniref:hypothetical protein n=1 Tax=Streptomyces sp. NPDC020875 TaxID=3154898 RepID=UPI0033F34FE6
MNEMPAPGAGLDGVRGALDVLGCWRLREWSVVARFAGRVGPLVREAYTASVVAEALPGYIRAGLGWCVADSLALGRTWPHGERAEEYGPRLADLCVDVAYFAALCDPAGAARWPEADPDRTRDAEVAEGLLRQWAELPAAWRAAVLRDLHHGARTRDPARPTLAEALAEAATYTEKGEPPPFPPYAALRGVDAPELAQRLRRLPRDWRTEAFRRIAAGADPLAVEADARKAIRTTVT